MRKAMTQEMTGRTSNGQRVANFAGKTSPWYTPTYGRHLLVVAHHLPTFPRRLGHCPKSFHRNLRFVCLLSAIAPTGCPEIDRPLYWGGICLVVGAIVIVLVVVASAPLLSTLLQCTVNSFRKLKTRTTDTDIQFATPTYIKYQSVKTSKRS